MPDPPPIVTIALNPAIDRTLSIDGFAIGRVNRVTAEGVQAGGKGVNVARTLANLGAAVVATGFLGEANSGIFEAMFAAKHIDDRFIRIPGETRVGIKIVDGGTTTDINFPGLSPSAEAQLLLFDRIAELASTGRWFVLGGSVPGGVASDVYARMIEEIHRRGGCVLLDTSGPALACGVAAKPEIVKPNSAELSELAGVGLVGGKLAGGDRYGGESDDGPPSAALSGLGGVARAARALFIARGVSLAVVSMGGDGAIFVDSQSALLATPPNVIVRGTVGAGDAMVAGIVFGRSRGLPLEETAALASSLGTYAVTRIAGEADAPDAHRRFAPRLLNLNF